MPGRSVYAEPERNSIGGALTRDHLSKSLLDDGEDEDVLTGIELGHQPVDDDNMPDYNEQMVGFKHFACGTAHPSQMQTSTLATRFALLITCGHGFFLYTWAFFRVF